MSDPLDASAIATHGVGGLSAGTLGAWLMHVFKSRKEDEEKQRRTMADQAIAVSLAQLDQKVDQLIVASQKHDGMAERLALVEQSVKSIHERLDGARKRR